MTADTWTQEEVINTSLIKVDSDESLIKAAIEQQDKVVDGYIKEAATDDELYPELLIQIKKAEEAYRKLYKEKQRIEDSRYKRQVRIDQENREKNRLEQILIERAELDKKLADAAIQIERLKAHALEQGFEWTKYALKHQWEGALTLASYGNSLLGDGTGTGKTLTSIMYCDMLPVGDRIGAKKVIAFVPNDLVTSYAMEVQQWAPHRKHVMPMVEANPGMRKLVKEFFNTLDEYFIVVNYEATWRDNTWLSDLDDVDCVIVDEAHNMKNTKGLTYDAVKNIRTDNHLPMTATFILNSADDIFASLNIIAPNRFSNIHDFRRNYLEQDFNGKWVFRPGGEKALIQSMGGRIVKRTMEDTGVTLPKQTVKEFLIKQEEVSAQQAEVMRQLKNFASLSIPEHGEMSVTAMIALITRERQAATYPTGIEAKVTEKMVENNPDLPPVGTVLFKVPDTVPSIKIDKAVERLKTVIQTGGKRAVVFSQFKTSLKALETRLKEEGIRVARFDGDTKQADRLIIKKDFLRKVDPEENKDFKFDVVLANFKTGGVGLTFTAATYMLMLDEEWNPGKNQQATARIHRIGQTEETLVEVMRVEKSIDMWMKTVNEQKANIIEGFEGEVASTKNSFAEYFADTNEVEPAKVVAELEEAEEILEEAAPIDTIDEEDLSFLDDFDFGD